MTENTKTVEIRTTEYRELLKAENALDQILIVFNQEDHSWNRDACVKAILRSVYPELFPAEKENAND